MNKKLQKRLNLVASVLEKIANTDITKLRSRYKAAKDSLEKATADFEKAKLALVNALMITPREKH